MYAHNGVSVRFALIFGLLHVIKILNVMTLLVF